LIKCTIFFLGLAKEMAVRAVEAAGIGEAVCGVDFGKHNRS